MMTAYLATALTTVGRYDSPYHLLLPLGVMTLLSAGARERFAVRKHPRRRYRAGQWVAVFAALAAGPVRQWRLPADRARRTGPAPLTSPARLNTVLVAFLLLGVIELARSNTRWGLRSTGHDWAPVHWAACCTGVLLLFALILLSLSTDVLAPAWCIAIGSAFSVAMAATALLPRREARSPDESPPSARTG